MGVIEDQIVQVIKKHEGVKFNKGEVVLNIGSKNNTIYYIRKGYVRQYMLTKEGKDVTLNIFGPKNIFPVSPIIGKSTVSYSYSAYKNVDLVPFDKDEVIYNIQNDPSLMMRLIKLIYDVNSRLSFILLNMLSGNAYKKLLSMLYILSQNFGESKSVPFKITHAELATLTGLSRETVTRELKKIRDDNFITVKNGKISLTDLLRIKAELA